MSVREEQLFCKVDGHEHLSLQMRGVQVASSQADSPRRLIV